MLVKSLLVLVFGLSLSSGDTPASCTFDEIKGEWIFYETERSHDSQIDCSQMGTPVHKKRISLEYPNVAVDGYESRGTWTMIYNQGFEVRVGGRSYFAFSFYTQKGENVTSYCDMTFVGWSRDITIRNWSCFKGRKVTDVEPKTIRTSRNEIPERNYGSDAEFISLINESQKSWRAKHYPQFELMTLSDLNKMMGGFKLLEKVKPAVPTGFTILRSMILPDYFDWRNVSGVNYISPVRNQGACGSCYGFASMAGLEARVRILTRNEQKPVFSVQDIIECSKLSQGCEGGFPYLIAGRYAQDHGVVLDECSKYDPMNIKEKCTTDPSCLRHYTAYYRYVGGYYGACNEEEMKLALVKGGPLMVGFEVYNDFMSYSGGVYHHTGLTSRFNPLEETNHAVLVVGYGVDEATGEKYWTVKNSWGEEWGVNGYFKIRRGNDECGIESMAVEVVPIPA